MTPDIEFEALAEDALLLRFGNRIDLDINARVQAAAACLRQRLPQLECVPADASLLLRFDPAGWSNGDGQLPDGGVQVGRADLGK